MTTVKPERDAQPTLRQACVIVLFAMLATNGLLLALQGLGISSDENANLSHGLQNTGLRALPDLLRESDVDSWKPMLLAYNEFRDGHSPYRLILEGRGKYQYPPTALLPVHVVAGDQPAAAESVDRGAPFNRWISLVSRLTVVGTIVVSVLLLLSVSSKLGVVRQKPRDVLAIAIAMGATGLCFYPLLRAHQLGQIQVFINFFLASALLSWIRGFPLLAGALVGICALIKPQYCVVGLWALLARQWPLALAMGGAGAAGLLASAAVFGIDVHLDYLHVLQRLSESGEVAWPNQSMNGLLNRLLGNGDPSTFDPSGFPPPHPTVQFWTTATSVLILGAALSTAWRVRGHSPSRLYFGFGGIIAAVTLASPIAWDHHYGIFLALFASLLPVLIQQGPVLRIISLGAFLALGCVLTVWEVVAATTPIRVLAGAHMYFGALCLFVVLILASHRAAFVHASRTS